ncbi:arabinosylfuranosidase ArfA [Lacisediminihabitans sp. FW035]
MLKAHLAVDSTMPIGAIDRRLFGSFVEHLGRAVYTGIYEPGHELADSDGFRQDVIDLVTELGATTIRYPGGNFVSGFRWEDSVGPREERPTRIDLAWHSTETNDIGLHEFAGWLDKVGGELMLAVNLGTRGTQEALDLLEYTNLRNGTSLSNARIRNGSTEPFGVSMWCLGNEMDGPWQLGHRSADDYGKLAAQTARAMRSFDPTLELVVCGSSSAAMPTFGEWERVVLTHTYEEVDYISCHAYYEDLGDRAAFLASGVDMDRFIETVVATADHVKAIRRSDKTINISFDEWNIWYNERFEKVDKIQGVDNWPIAPRLLEDAYTVTDAVVFGSLLISLLKHADRVTSASLAQLVNVIAPIMTEPGGASWRQTTFFPFAATAANARGESLSVKVDCDTYTTATFGDVPIIDAVATRDPISGNASVYLVNRSQDEEAEVVVDLRDIALGTIDARTLSDEDPDATNTLETPTRVGLERNTSLQLVGSRLSIVLPPISWTEITVTNGEVAAAPRSAPATRATGIGPAGSLSHG